jgi:hypothetical protein
MALSARKKAGAGMFRLDVDGSAGTTAADAAQQGKDRNGRVA